jgi:hypothetical protein
MIDITHDIASLSELGSRELQGLWRRLYRTEPPMGLSRDLRIRAIAYRMQERVHGGLSQPVKRKLRLLARQLEGEGGGALDPGIALKPGTRLVREWGDRTHIVVVVKDGFDYGGRRYPSLSKIAQEITGARWSGPRFFGLKKAARPFSGQREVQDG